MSYRISVIIPTYRNWEDLNNCLIAISNQSLNPKSFEVLVVNNDKEWRGELDLSGIDNLNIRLYHEDKPGSYAARNKGIEEAQTDLLAFTDSDCIPHTDWLSSAVKLFEKNPNVTRIGGGVNVFKPGGGTKLAFLYERWLAFDQKYYVNQCNAAVTANMFSYREVFQKAGLFDQLLMSGGDIEWGSRAANAGSQIQYCEACSVGHPARESLKALAKKRRRTTGGVLESRFPQMNFRRKVLFLALMVFPPIHFFRKVRSNFAEKIWVVLIGWYLGLTAFHEFFSILFRIARRKRT